MNWINNLFYMGLFTALTGSIAFAVYAVVAGVLDGLKKYRYIYGLLLVVLPFWLYRGGRLERTADRHDFTYRLHA